MQRSCRVSTVFWWLFTLLGLLSCVVCCRDRGADRLEELTAPELPTFNASAPTNEPSEGTGNSVPTDQADDHIELPPLRLNGDHTSSPQRAPVSQKARPQS